MSDEKIQISYVVTRGDGIGTVLTPHVHNDGRYVASKTRFEKDYVRVESLREVRILATHGFSIRMSNQQNPNHRAPSLIASGSLEIGFDEAE
jgi:hypothetical protein